MVLLAKLIIAAVASLPSAAAPPMPQPNMRVHERLSSLPKGYTAVGKADADASLTLHLALTPRNEDGLIDTLYRVSDPKSAEYGKHLSNDQIGEFMAPTAEASSAVGNWLSANGVKFQAASPAGDWLKLTIAAAHANALFDANFTVFKHGATGTQVIRTLQYSLPEELQPYISLLFPGISFGSPHAQPRVTLASPLHDSAVPAQCATSITPECVLALYGIPATPATQPSNTFAIAGFNDMYANREDLQQFLEKYRPDIANATFQDVLLDGGMNLQDLSKAGKEANLDIQYSVGIATNVPTYFVSVGNHNNDSLAGYLDIVLFFKAWPNQPQVMSTSYLFDESDHSASLLDRWCSEHAALGARGTSILFATGDFGVAGKSDQPCDEFIPTSPVSCPFVTGVGSTSGIPETGADFSSGGFSNHFDIPDYQADAVNAYLDTIGDLYEGLFNPDGRGIPDVSAIGDHIVIQLQGDEMTDVFGTSASTPIFASVIALINDRRAARGMPSLGFLNPFLYANPQAFNDITTGSNPGCDTDGFPAAPGWDPVTGLGTPVFAALAAAAGV